MSIELRITVPMPPNLLNRASRHSNNWRTIAREKRQYLATLDTLQMVRQIVGPPVTPLRRVTITSVMYLGTAMDADNAMARHKWPLDWIATRGYVRNDRDLEWQTVPRQVVKRTQQYRIEITLTEITP